MVVSTTHLVFCPNFSFTDEFLTYLLSKIGAEGYISLGVMSRGKMTLAPRCNAKSYSMFVSATHLMFYPNFSITGELLTYIWGEISTHWYMSLGDTSRVNMTLAPRCNAKSYSMFISDTHLTSCPNFSITGELLTYLWGKIGAQGYMGWGVMSRGNMTLARRCNAETHYMVVSTTQLTSYPKFQHYRWTFDLLIE